MKKFFAIFQILTLLWGLQAPAIVAAANKGQISAAVRRMPGLAKGIVGATDAANHFPALGLPHPAVPFSAALAVNAAQNLEQNTSALTGLLRHGSEASLAASAENLAAARNNSEENFRESAALGIVNAQEDDAQTPRIAGAGIAAGNLSRTVRLENGIEATLVRRPGQFTMSIVEGFAVGGRDEAPGESEYSHIIEHIRGNGGRNFNWIRMLRAMGDTPNAFTERDYTYYVQQVPKRFLKAVLFLLADRMKNTEITTARLEREKRIILEEKASQENSPYHSGFPTLLSLIFTNPNNRANAIGSERDIRSATPKSLQRYLDAHYTPDKAKVVITGDINLDETEFWVRKYLGPVPARNRPIPKLDLSDKPQTHARVANILDPLAFDPALYFGWQGPRYGTPDYYASSVLGTMLWHRLNKLLPPARGIEGFSFRVPYLERDPIAISGSIVLGPRETPEEILRMLEDEIAALERTGGTPEEVSKAAQLQSSIIEMELNRSDNANFLFRAAARGLSEAAVREDVVRWKNVTADDIRRAARLWAKNKRSVVLVRPAPLHKRQAVEQTPDDYHLPSLEEPPTKKERRLLHYLSKLPLPPINLKSPDEFVLPNGLKVIVLPDNRRSIVWAKLAFRRGPFANDPLADEIIPRAAILLQQKTEYKSEEQITAALERMKGTLTSHQESGHTIFTGIAPSGHERGLLTLMTEIVSHPHAWTEEELIPWKEEWKQRWEASLRDPKSLSLDRAVTDLFATQPYQPTGSIDETIDAMTPSNIASLMTQHFVPDNAFLVLAGKIDRQNIREVLTTLFSGWQPTRDSPDPNPDPEAPVIRPQTDLSLIDKPGYEQYLLRLTAISLGAGDPSSPVSLPLNIANHIYGAGVGSRLYSTLRESLGYAYSPFSKVLRSPELAIWTFGIKTRTNKPGAALKVLLDQAKKMRSEEPSPLELLSAKNNLIASFLFSLDYIGDIASRLVERELFRLPLNEWGLYPAQVAQVTGELVRQASHHLLDPQKIAITVVGKAAAVRKELSKIRPINEYDQDLKPKLPPPPPPPSS